MDTNKRDFLKKAIKGAAVMSGASILSKINVLDAEKQVKQEKITGKLVGDKLYLTLHE